MTDKQVKLLSWNRFITRHFLVAPELLGLSHEFPFENGLIIVQLPSKDNLPEQLNEKSIRQSGDSELVSIMAWREEQGQISLAKLSVNSVDIYVQQDNMISLPEDAINSHPNPTELLSSSQQAQLDDLARTHHEVACRAFDLWIRTLRWKTGRGTIGRPEVHGFKSGWWTYLLDDSTKRRFWVHHDPFTLTVFDLVTLEKWNETKEVLRLGQKPPVYVDLMFDGMEELRLGNRQRSVVDLAVGCEAFMRLRLMQSLPNSLNDAVRKYIDEANIRLVLERLFPEILSEEQRKNIKNLNPILHQLFDARNIILHSGSKNDLTKEECEKYIEATKKFIALK